jgi:iron(III) transport system substrate-binding protein
LTSGEIVAAPLVNALVNEVESGAPVDWKMSAKPWGAPWYTHALKSAPHPNAAQVLVDFIASLDGQTALGYGYATTVPGIEGSIADAADVTFADPSDLTSEDITTRQAAWEKLFLRK